MNTKKIEQLTALQPELRVETDPDICAAYALDWTRHWPANACAVAFPESVDQVRRLVCFAAVNRLPLVPSGGRTGLSGGAVAADQELVVSLERMRRVLEFDPVDRTLTVESGVTTAQVQAAAMEQGLVYPVSFAAEGSSQIGGNIATNAGGIKVLRNGLTRDWVAGMKVITGAGELLDLNCGLVKNATGYDLRHLMIGSEGTLGLIVEATLKLTDPPPAQSVMVLGLTDLKAVMQLFDQARRRLTLSAFEFFTDAALDHVCRGHDLQAPLDTACPVYVLLEFDNPDELHTDTALALFEQSLEDGLVSDGVISQSVAQARELWRFREGISESIAPRQPYKNDLSVRVSRVPELMSRLEQLVNQNYPEFEVLWYGHIGDGNLHLNILKPESMPGPEFEQICQAVNREIFTLVQELAGSISAEHGVGLLKQPYLGYSRSEPEIHIMAELKRLFDPVGIMNPGKLLPAGD